MANMLGEGTIVRAEVDNLFSIGPCKKGDFLLYHGPEAGGGWQVLGDPVTTWALTTVDETPLPDTYTFIKVVLHDPKVKKKQNQYGLKSGDVFVLEAVRWYHKPPKTTFLFMSGMYYNLDAELLRPSTSFRFGRRYRPKVIANLSGTGPGFYASYEATKGPTLT